jgi:predicted secreted hydrolase
VTATATLLWFGYLLVRPAANLPAPQSVLPALWNTGAQAYAQADHIRRFHFPKDHGAHPAFRHEWWYFTGNLKTAGGRRFGYELTIFRIALSPLVSRSGSRWATNQLYMAHLALTDKQARRFYAFERFARGALGLAGARAAPFKVWLEDWSVAAIGKEGLRWRLKAAIGKLAITLELDAGKPTVLQGDHGLDLKSAQGHASYYYSYTRLNTVGRLRIGDNVFQLRGLSWLDREWSSGALARDQAGWDWFALQLDNGFDLMFYRLRKDKGPTDRNSSGAWVSPRGAKTSLAYDEVILKTLAYWDSPLGGKYPARWRLHLPEQDCRLTIKPILADQELNVSVRYWEGAVDVGGACRSRPVSGWGYVELTGYARAL